MNVVLQSNLPRITSFPVMVLDEVVQYLDVLPGTNEIRNHDLDRLNKVPEFKNYLENKNFTIVSSKSGEPVEIYEMAASLAKDTVQATDNTELLRKWEKNETRSTVLAVIKEKLAAINKERGTTKKTV